MTIIDLKAFTSNSNSPADLAAELFNRLPLSTATSCTVLAIACMAVREKFNRIVVGQIGSIETDDIRTIFQMSGPDDCIAIQRYHRYDDTASMSVIEMALAKIKLRLEESL